MGWHFSSENDRVWWIYRVVIICFGAQILCGPYLWILSGSTFPEIPIHSFFQLPFFTNWQFVIGNLLLLVLLISLFFKNHYRRFILLIIGLSLLLIAINLQRLQVWVYLWLLVLVIIWVAKNESGFIFKMLFGAVYFWSGFHKWNNYFIADIFPWLIENLTLFDNSNLTGWAISAAGFECLLGIGLWIPFTRKAAVWALVLFHIGILFLLGPFGHNWNPVIWPWNIAMPILAWLIFYPSPEGVNKFTNKSNKKNPAVIAIFLLAGILPGLNFFQLWPETLSFKMYAGSQPEIILYFSEEDQHCMPQQLSTYLAIPPDNTPVHRILVDDWSFEQLGVPPFATLMTAKIIGLQLCPCMTNKSQSGVEYLQVHPWDQNQEKIVGFNCLELEE